MIRSEEITDYYDEGQYLRRWSVDESGQAVCADDAFLVADLTAQEVSDQEAANAAVKASIEAVEAYEAALKLSAQDEPPATVTEYDEQGEPSEVTNPDHTAWVEAGNIVANVSAETLELAQKRAGTWVEPEEDDELV
jgi:uncharacterized membrane protein